jgi:hypothetical protein
MRYHFVVPAAAGPLSAADEKSLAGIVERSAAAAAAAAAAALPATSPVNGPNQSAAAAIHARDMANKAAAAHGQAEVPAAAGGEAGQDTAAEQPAAPAVLSLPTEDALESLDRAVGARPCQKGVSTCHRGSYSLHTQQCPFMKHMLQQCIVPAANHMVAVRLRVMWVGAGGPVLHAAQHVRQPRAPAARRAAPQRLWPPAACQR